MSKGHGRVEPGDGGFRERRGRRNSHRRLGRRNSDLRSKITGVKLTTGETIEARSVASNADAHVTFEKLIPAGTLPDSFQNAVSRIDYSSASMKINIAVSELPDFTCMPGKSEPGPQHRGTIHIGATCEEINGAYDDAKYGQTFTTAHHRNDDSHRRR